MAIANGVTQLANLIPEIWSSQMYAQLRNQMIFGKIFERKYEGAIANMGDIVRVNQVAAPTGEILTDDTAAFTPETLTINQLTVTANKRASAAVEITDLAKLQSMEFQMELQDALVYAISKQLESAIIAALVPSAAAPDHQIAPASASAFAPVDLGSARTLLSIQNVPVDNRYAILDPQYYGDLFNSTAMVSTDYVSGKNGEEGVIQKYMGFKILEHSLLTADVAHVVHPSALQLVMQQDVRVKISDLHANKYYGYLVSADFVFGLSLWDNKRIVKITG